jgi:3-oxoacyl-[acyl-carrier-protein] synthase II
MDVNSLRQLMEEQLKLSRRLTARVQELEAAQRAPLAIVGMALRLPGGLTSPEDYWRFLQGSSTALAEIPADRPGLHGVYDARPDQPGRSYVKQAGFLNDVASFDASFFGISQREAEALDPQQRLLLETSWEAMERAGIPIRRQERLKAGVFVGIMASEYGERISDRPDKSAIDPYYGTGGGHCFAAGRISYALGFSGPALSVDTACSSSLVALHLGAQSLRRGECRYALVGGSNLIFSPSLMVSLCQSKALSPDGRSKTFTAEADGYGRGEGVGILVLMRLDEAQREGRQILAVVRGTAVNHDGASSGLTVPSGPAQQEVIRAALADGGIAPEEVGYVEAHGTGTALGDPIEVGALDAVVGTGATARRIPLAIGSVKSRLGHLEAAAGIAGLIKLVLMLRHAEIPSALLETDGKLNPLVAWDRLKLSVPRQAQRWPADFPRRVAGISAFGLSGTNAHALLEAYEAKQAEAPVGAARGELLTLSAKDPASLKELAASVSAFLQKLEPALLPSACHTLRVGRAPFGQRLAVTGSTPAELAEKLKAAAEGSTPTPTATSVLTVNLRLGPVPEQIAQGVQALTSAFPQLGAAQDAAAKPEVQLERLLQRFGLRVKSVTDASLTGFAAQLEWGGSTRPQLISDASAAPKLLLDALAALFNAGTDLRFDGLQVPGARILGELPTYAFRRKRFWIDEAPSAAAALTSHLATAAAKEPSAQRSAPVEAIEAFLLAELKDVLRAEGEFDRAQTFLGIGGDSFTAMLLKKSIEQQYNVDIPLEALAVDLPLSELLGRLCEHIIRASAPAQAERPTG